MKTSSPVVEKSVILDAVYNLLIKINIAFEKHYAQTFTYLLAPTIHVDGGGRKYLRINRTENGSNHKQTCVYFFVDLSTGDILKPASYKTPALNFARGNVLNDNALTKLTPYGVNDGPNNLQAILDS